MDDDEVSQPNGNVHANQHIITPQAPGRQSVGEDHEAESDGYGFDDNESEGNDSDAGLRPHERWNKAWRKHQADVARHPDEWARHRDGWPDDDIGQYDGIRYLMHKPPGGTTFHASLEELLAYLQTKEFELCVRRTTFEGTVFRSPPLRLNQRFHAKYLPSIARQIVAWVHTNQKIYPNYWHLDHFSGFISAILKSWKDFSTVPDGFRVHRKSNGEPVLPKRKRFDNVASYRPIHAYFSCGTFTTELHDTFLMARDADEPTKGVAENGKYTRKIFCLATDAADHLTLCFCDEFNIPLSLESVASTEEYPDLPQQVLNAYEQVKIRRIYRRERAMLVQSAVWTLFINLLNEEEQEAARAKVNPEKAPGDYEDIARFARLPFKVSDFFMHDGTQLRRFRLVDGSQKGGAQIRKGFTGKDIVPYDIGPEDDTLKKMHALSISRFDVDTDFSAALSQLIKRRPAPKLVSTAESKQKVPVEKETKVTKQVPLLEQNSLIEDPEHGDATRSSLRLRQLDKRKQVEQQRLRRLNKRKQEKQARLDEEKSLIIIDEEAGNGPRRSLRLRHATDSSK